LENPWLKKCLAVVLLAPVAIISDGKRQKREIAAGVVSER